MTEDSRIFSKTPRKINLPLALVCFAALYLLVRGLVQSRVKGLFFDEMLTWIVASQPGLHGIWQALRHALDGQPPLFYIVEKAALILFGNTQVSLRLPSVIATAIAMLCVYLFARRKQGEWVALACALALMATSLLHVYGANARPYSLVMACYAFAMLCYQRLPSWRYAVLLGLSLALAESLYYYAVLGLVPFAIAEAAVLIRCRLFRMRAWLALTVGAVPLIPFWPLLSIMRTYYGAHYWVDKPSLVTLPKFYGEYVLTDSAYGAATLAVLLVGMLAYLFREKSELLANDGTLEFTDGVLILGLLTLPLFAFVAIKVIHGAMLERYVLETILGISLAVGCLLSRASRLALVLFFVFIGSNIGVHEFSFWRRVPGARPDSGTRALEEFLEPYGSLNLPVVIPAGIEYLTIQHYASPKWADRLVFVGDPELAIKYVGTDSVDKNILDLQPYANIRAETYSDFVSKHTEFLLYTEDNGAPYSWLAEKLSEKPWSLKTLETKQARKLFLVTSSPAQTGQD